ncbi:hypothetical protein V8G54_012583 [Vigna mungo]|uniref:Uncharacterized protein n=1 Tax=Vigna mungo TaxID=3915 RepID=A0AAQ3S2G4_VIGMU
MQNFILGFYEGLSPTDRSWSDVANEGSFLDRSPEDGIDIIKRKAVENQQYGTRENSVTLLKGIHEMEISASKLDEIASLFKTSTPQIAKKAFAANMFGGNKPYQNYHDSSFNRYQQNIPQNVNVITLRTGKQVQDSEGVQEDEDKEKEDTQIDDNGGRSERSPETTTDISRLVSSNSSSKNSSSSYCPPPPYPNQLKPRKKEEQLDQEILNTFKKVEINIPLLDVVKQIPKYGKFFKELCTNIRHFRDNKVVNLGRNVSSLVKKHIEIPQRCKDPSMFFVPCVIGNSRFDNAMLDLGASINVMSLSMFTSLSLGPLKITGVVIQLANLSIVNPVGVLEDVLDKEGIKSSTIILGRPFMMTTRTKINVHVGTLTMEIGDEKVWFNVLEAGKHPIEDQSLFCIDLLSDVIGLPMQLDRCHYRKALARLLFKWDETLGLQIELHDTVLHWVPPAGLGYCWLQWNSAVLGSLVEDAFLWGSFARDLLWQKGAISSGLTHQRQRKGSQIKVDRSCPKVTGAELVEMNVDRRAQIEGCTMAVRLRKGSVEEKRVASKFFWLLDFAETIARVTGRENLGDFRRIKDSLTDNEENYKVGDIEDPMSINDTFVASECDAGVSSTLELKPLPSHFKYAYLEKGGKLHEEQLLQVIKEHKKAIGWTLADIPDISPTFCLHKILQEEDVNPKEDTKLLQASIIYPISNSSWVSPIHVVPKKYGITMVKNEKNKLTPIQDRSGAHNLVVDHLIKIEKGKDNISV